MGPRSGDDRTRGAPSGRRKQRAWSYAGRVPASGPRWFATPAEFRAWLERHHAAEDEVPVGFHKKGSGRPSMSWAESVDEALCFGWIDGVRRGLDETSYTIRFTPRRRRSIWSLVNVKHVERLQKEGRMQPAGLEAYARRDPKLT